MAERKTDESEESEDNDNAPSIDIDDLTDAQKEMLLSNPQVKKTLTYEQTALTQIVPMLANLKGDDEGTTNHEAYSLLVKGIAERSGRVTESTVQKVLDGFVEEYNSVTES